MTWRAIEQEAGFSVLEALVALTILTMSTAAVLSVFGIARLSDTRMKVAVSNVSRAQALLDRVGLDIALEPGSTGGSFANGAVWQVNITPLLDAYEKGVDRVHPLYDVRVLVSSNAPDPQDFVLRSVRREFAR